MAEKDTKPTDNKQDDMDLKKQFQEDLAESKAYMDPIQMRMDKDYEVYRNYRYTDDCEFKISDFFAYVETVVPIVTNNRIRANVSSEYPDYITHAKGLNDILDHTYDVNNWDYISQEVFRMALIYRSGLVYTGYDKEYKNGTGKLCLDHCNSRWIWVDPAATHLEESRFFIYAEPVRKTQAFKMYPKKKSEIKSSTQDNTGGGIGLGRNSGDGSSWFRTWLGTVKSFLLFNNQATQAKRVEPYSSTPEISEEDKYKNVLAHIHYWYRDDNDKWRVSYWIDDVLCHDESNPFWHERLPYDMLSPIKDPLSMLGVPINEQLENMNVQRNLLMQYYINNAKLHGNPPLIYNTTFGNVRDAEKLNQQASGSGIIPVNNPDMVPLNALADYMNVPVMPGSATSLFDHLGSIQDNISGINDSFRGTAQASSGKEVQLQQEAAYTRIKTMIDQFEMFNKSIAEKIISNAMQFYNQTRAFRIKGDYTKYDDIQKMQGEDQEMPFEIKQVQRGVNEQGQPVYDRTEFFMYANPNEWTKLKPEPDEEEDDFESKVNKTFGNYAEDDDKEGKEEESAAKKETKKAFKVLQMTVEIEAGSSLPQSRIARREEASELFQAGAIDQEALLDAYDYPDRDKIMKRMQERAQQQQEAQAQAAQAETQAKLQGEQMKLQMQMQMEQVKLQADMAKNKANNEAKIQQQQVANRGKAAEQGVKNSGDSVAEGIARIRQAAPNETQNLSDEQILQLLAQ